MKNIACLEEKIVHQLLKHNLLFFRPSGVILFIVGGMVSSGIDSTGITTLVLLSLVVCAYTLVCLFTSQNFQFKVSKILTFIFAVIMCILAIGMALQVSRNLQERGAEPTPILNTTAILGHKSLQQHSPAGVRNIYLAVISGIFVAAALMHPTEFTCLLRGVWYLLCLPSGSLLLTIYSLCNITDRSWGRFIDLLSKLSCSLDCFKIARTTSC